MSGTDGGVPTRLDLALVARGLARSRASARDAILRGHVRLAGRPALRPAELVAPDERLEIDDPAGSYVARSALKLIAALDRFGHSPAGRVALDLGASTGGFTQVLLERGAIRVHAVDVGHGQLAPSVAADPRVINHEGVNARDLDAALIAESVGAITADLSFISLRLALPPALRLAALGAWGAFLFKPQFELGRAAIGKGGIVRDPKAAEEAAARFAEWLGAEQGWRVEGLVPSPIEGGDGNREWLVGARHG